MQRLIKAFVFGFAAMAAMPAAAQTITPGNVPQPNDANLLSTGATGNPVTALTDGSAFQVTIQGTENLVTSAAGLQLTVAAADGGFSTLTFSLADPNYTFSSLILNLDASQDGFVTFDAGAGQSGAFALDDNGFNFFTITGGPFTSLSFFTTSVTREAIEKAGGSVELIERKNPAELAAAKKGKVREARLADKAAKQDAAKA